MPRKRKLSRGKIAAKNRTLRSRRNAAQLHGLAGVEREIRAVDSSARKKYIQEFTRAFRSYQSVIEPQEMTAAVSEADILLIGDYHALPSAQRFASALLEQRAQPGDRPLVLGVEPIFSRDQHILDEWWRREINDEELRRRVRFDLDWGYEWGPFHELLMSAREHAEGIYALDCSPRDDLRKIAARDRHAAHKIGEIRKKHPNAVIMVLFGESHMAPQHLPALLRMHHGGERMLTLLQNVDPLYWRAAGEPEHVEAVRVDRDVFCVFNSTPLEKYENYRLCLRRWSREDHSSADLAPTIYNLIGCLLRFLNVNCYSAHNGTQPKFLVDLLPEVYSGFSDAELLDRLSRKGVTREMQELVLGRIEERGGAYLPELNIFCIRDFHMAHAAEDAATFVHHACRGLPFCNQPEANGDEQPPNHFYERVVENAIAHFGARVLCPSRGGANGHSASEKRPRPEFAVSNGRYCAASKTRVIRRRAKRKNGSEADAREVGNTVGNILYGRYLGGQVTRPELRTWFTAPLEKMPGLATEIMLEIVGPESDLRRPQAKFLRRR
ncbi:MAG: ChaN family lipoprotein [Acidobacteriales bacterium]|nr:ChaN family lipoprotein [Terriglobales bacterium]